MTSLEQTFSEKIFVRTTLFNDAVEKTYDLELCNCLVWSDSLTYERASNNIVWYNIVWIVRYGIAWHGMARYQVTIWGIAAPGIPWQKMHGAVLESAQSDVF